MHRTIYIAGVDEAGRGPLAGPVVAAAVILDRSMEIPGISDSKKLTPAKRETLAEQIMKKSVAWSVSRCISSLSTRPDKVLVDGIYTPDIDIPSKAIIKGDQSVPEISAASIIAKVYRDREMQQLDNTYPGYGFAKHKGYPTRDHIAALNRLGVCPIHRRSFSPVRAVLQKMSG